MFAFVHFFIAVVFYLSPSLAFIRASSQTFHPYNIKYISSLQKKKKRTVAYILVCYINADFYTCVYAHIYIYTHTCMHIHALTYM